MKFKPEFELRFVYLSGDDPDTDKNENFDPLFSRAPYWNELLIYTQIYEVMRDSGAIPGYWTNSQLFMAKVSMELTPDTKLALSYQYWRANEDAQLCQRLQCSAMAMREDISRHYSSPTNSIKI